MSYAEQLARELAAAGMDGPLRRRIVTEVQDHLACDPEADMGEAAALARQFADELGTRRAVRAAFVAFAALAVAGLCSRSRSSPSRREVAFPPPGGSDEHIGRGRRRARAQRSGAQVALVVGTLGLARALRRRRTVVVSRGEALVLVRRAYVGLLAAAVTMAGLALTAIGLDGRIAGWWTWLALAVAAAGLLALALALPAVRAARRLQPQGEGGAGDLGDDLGGTPAGGLGRRGLVLRPSRSRSRSPWRSHSPAPPPAIPSTGPRGASRTGRPASPCGRSSGAFSASGGPSQPPSG